MFPTPEERYYRYVAWCVLLEVEAMPKDAYLREVAKIPEHLPLGWTASSAFKGIRA